jgi:hypothetical protein
LAGFGWHTRYRLIWGSGPGTTVHDDAAADGLSGDPAGSSHIADWIGSSPIKVQHPGHDSRSASG